jgi:hypothetical protein
MIKAKNILNKVICQQQFTYYNDNISLSATIGSMDRDGVMNEVVDSDVRETAIDGTANERKQSKCSVTSSDYSSNTFTDYISDPKDVYKLYSYVDVLTTNNISTFQSNYFSLSRPVLITDNITKHTNLWNYEYFNNMYYTTLECSNQSALAKTNIKSYYICNNKFNITLNKTLLDIRNQWKVLHKDFYYDHSNKLYLNMNGYILLNESATNILLNTKKYRQSISMDVSNKDIDDMESYTDMGIFPFQCEGIDSVKDGKSYLRTTLLSKTNVSTSGIIEESSTAMWNVLLRGREKTWYLTSPGASMHISNYTNNTQSLRPIYWVNSIYPLLREKGLTVEVKQRIGDVIFIPHGWSYVTVASESSLDFSQHFCLFENSNVSITNQVSIDVRMYGKHIHKNN